MRIGSTHDLDGRFGSAAGRRPRRGLFPTLSQGPAAGRRGERFGAKIQRPTLAADLGKTQRELFAASKLQMGTHIPSAQEDRRKRRQLVRRRLLRVFKPKYRRTRVTDDRLLYPIDPPRYPH